MAHLLPLGMDRILRHICVYQFARPMAGLVIPFLKTHTSILPSIFRLSPIPFPIYCCHLQPVVWTIRSSAASSTLFTQQTCWGMLDISCISFFWPTESISKYDFFTGKSKLYNCSLPERVKPTFALWVQTGFVWYETIQIESHSRSCAT